MQTNNSSRSNQSKKGEYSERLSNKKDSGFHESFRLGDDFFRNVVGSIDDYAVLTTDLEGIVSSWNQGAKNLFGYSENEIIGKNCDILFNSADIKHGVPTKQMKSALKTGRAKDERWHLGKNGKKIWVSGIIFPLKDDSGKIRGFAKILRDMTGAMQLNQHKDDFIGIAAHELKTPVTSIKAYGQVLEIRFKKAGDDKSAELLRKMDVQLDRLTDLIGDLLDITRIETNRFQLNNDTFDFDIFIKELVHDFQQTSMRHKLIIKGKTNSRISIDQDRVKQVINNLVSNAIKYSPDAKEITIHVSNNKLNVQLRVEDNGIGIDPKAKNKVFQRFYRVSGPNQKSYPGLGIGLYVSSEIIKRLGGKIWVESTLGKGSTFCITLPIKPPKSKRLQNSFAEESIKHE